MIRRSRIFVIGGPSGTLVGTACDQQRDLTYSMEITVMPKQLQTPGWILPAAVQVSALAA
ncbi:hypothetical protein GCM10028812_50960 [Ancylobacter sonchi]